MAAPNIVNVTTITGVTTFHAGIAVTTGGRGDLGITTVVSNASASGKVLKINSLVAAGIADTTGVTLQYFNDVNHVSASSTVSIAMTVSVPTYSTLVLISKENSVYLEENTSLGIFAQPNTGSIDVVCSYEEIS
jgi:hypothetical protein|tara:strand:- start:60 stop:461 length:402 start_codon:yes stop_codon:yes gene_type:complete